MYKQHPPTKSVSPVVELPVDVVAGDFANVGNAQVARINGNLVLEQADDLLDALLTKDVGKHEGTADTNSLDAEGEQLQGVASVANSAVGVHLGLLEHLGGLLVDLNGHLERRGRVVKLAAAVIGEDDGGGVVLDGQLGISNAANALDDDGQIRQLLEPLVVLPLQRVSKRLLVLGVVELTVKAE